MIAIACDHAGPALKEEIKALLTEMGYTYKDFGTDTAASVDYPVYGSRAAYAVASGECHAAVLPFENSSAGEVGQVADILFSGSLYVTGAYDLSVSHDLLVIPGTTIDEITDVVSHPQALAQCDPYIRKH